MRTNLKCGNTNVFQEQKTKVQRVNTDWIIAFRKNQRQNTGLICTILTVQIEKFHYVDLMAKQVNKEKLKSLWINRGAFRTL